MGRLLARHLGLALGDQVRVTLPDIAITPAGVYPRVRRFTLVGVFEVGAQMDQTLVMIHLDDAQRLLRRSGPQGLHLKVSDIYRAGPVMAELDKTLCEAYENKACSTTHGCMFLAVHV